MRKESVLALNDILVVPLFIGLQCTALTYRDLGECGRSELPFRQGLKEGEERGLFVARLKLMH